MLMEEKIVKGWAALSRVELDRLFRSYRRYNATRGTHRSANAPLGIDDSIVFFESLKVKETIMSLEDPLERALLYNYYIAGLTLEKSGDRVGVSLRSATRIKKSALENILRRMKEMQGRT